MTTQEHPSIRDMAQAVIAAIGREGDNLEPLRAGLLAAVKPFIARPDLFSLGVMLFQMVSGQLPFRGDSMATLMFGIANEPHPDILEIKQDLPEALKALVDRAA